MEKDEFVQIADYKHCGLRSGLLTGRGAEPEQGFQPSKRRPDYHNVAYRSQLDGGLAQAMVIPSQLSIFFDIFYATVKTYIGFARASVHRTHNRWCIGSTPSWLRQ